MKLFIARIGVVAFSALSQGFALGAGWLTQPSPTLSNLHGISHSDARTWIAVGDGGTIVRSIDGGTVWSKITGPIADNLRGVSFRGPIGVAVGFSGQVLRSTDAGSSWTQETRPTTKNLYAVCVGDSFAVITGEEGTILISTDAGLTWSQRTAGTASVLFGVSISGRTAVGVGGQGAIVNSDNGGQGWGLQVMGAGQQLFFYATSFASATTGWAVGAYQVTGSILLKTTQSGFVWTLQSAPTTSALYGVSFTSIDSGTAVGSDGTIVGTTDGGAVWTLQQSNTSRSLNAVSFVDPLDGIAVGDSGTILLTTNGLTALAQEFKPGLPDQFRLEQNYPNPFNPTTVIRYQVPAVSSQWPIVSLKVYDLLGREVSVLVNEQKAPGSYTAHFDASGFASGAYLYRLTAGTFAETRRMVLVR
ncbi:MAG: T9SS type A sorting domain-containing protein [Acidobacteriia bacterium]|nr:T9SS type A sorting domain-containing protein [Terriglobia bacterium]